MNSGMGEGIDPLAGGKMEIRVQRHDAHELGALTVEGREHARQTAEERVSEYLDKDPETNFMVIASDQIFDENEPELGNGAMRAKQTAQEITGAIGTALEERGLPADHLFGNGEEPITLSPEIREADIFSNEYWKFIQEKYPDKSLGEKWNLYYQDAEPVEREKRLAESSKDLAQRMDYMIKVAEMVGASFYKIPGKENGSLVVWMVGHGGGIDSYAHHYAGVPLEEVGFPTSGGIRLYINESGELVAEVKGKEYPLKSSDQLDLPESFKAKI